MSAATRLLLACLALGFSVPATAQGGSALSAARQSGIVGERFDGYLGFAAAAPEAVRRQVGAVNIKRRSLYSGLAGRKNVTVDAVGIAAGCELLAKVAVGESYFLNDGRWHRRAAGEGPPAPTYCGG